MDSTMQNAFKAGRAAGRRALSRMRNDSSTAASAGQRSMLKLTFAFSFRDAALRTGEIAATAAENRPPVREDGATHS